MSTGNHFLTVIDEAIKANSSAALISLSEILDSLIACDITDRSVSFVELKDYIDDILIEFETTGRLHSDHYLREMIEKSLT